MDVLFERTDDTDFQMEQGQYLKGHPCALQEKRPTLKKKDKKNKGKELLI